MTALQCCDLRVMLTPYLRNGSVMLRLQLCHVRLELVHLCRGARSGFLHCGMLVGLLLQRGFMSALQVFDLRLMLAPHCRKSSTVLRLKLRHARVELLRLCCGARSSFSLCNMLACLLL